MLSEMALSIASRIRLYLVGSPFFSAKCSWRGVLPFGFSITDSPFSMQISSDNLNVICILKGKNTIVSLTHDDFVK